jgi:hypothetical protein
MTAARVRDGHAMGELHGERWTNAVPKSSRVQAGKVHLGDSNDIELVIEPAVKVG